MPWWGWLALGVSVGVVAGVLMMALLVAAARVPVEDTVDTVADELRERRDGGR